jgi:Lon protease-like protein
MTLKGVVLFPQAMLPLRIFEERYKQMLTDILQKDRMFAVVAERDNHPSENSLTEPPFDVATVGLVRVSKTHSDETSFVMLEGVTRIRIRSIISESPYRVVEAEPFETIVEPKIPSWRNKIFEALVQNKKLGGDISQETLEYLNILEDDIAFTDVAAFTLCKNTIRKQAMLEVQRLHKRAEMFFDDLMRENLELSLNANLTNGCQGLDLDRN